MLGVRPPRAADVDPSGGLMPGRSDRRLIYTDGLVEARDPGGTFFPLEDHALALGAGAWTAGSYGADRTSRDPAVGGDQPDFPLPDDLANLCGLHSGPL